MDRGPKERALKIFIRGVWRDVLAGGTEDQETVDRVSI